MKKSKRIDINRIRALHEEIQEFNEMELNDVEFVEDGKVVNIKPKVIKDWLYCGLCNRDFIVGDFYKRAEGEGTHLLFI